MRSLQQISLERLCHLLKSGYWIKCGKNPFLLMPVAEVDRWMTRLLSFPAFIKPSDLQLIFQSGQLSKIDLSTLLVDEERHLLLSWMTVDTCKNLRTLSVLHPLCDASGVSVLNDLLPKCRNLEAFHSRIDIDLNALRNCHKLKTLKLHPEVEVQQVSEDFLSKMVDISRSNHHNLEEFSFCNIENGNLDCKVIRAILENCPRIISLGLVDSLNALYEIREERGSSVKFHLQRCLWGRKGKYASTRRVQLKDYDAKFPDLIKNAVHMCPDVTHLIINVYNEESLEHLIPLEKLISLSVNFRYYIPDNLHSLIFLIRRIGHRLDHLSIDISDPIPLQMISYCTNLRTLRINGKLYLPEGQTAMGNRLLLENLFVWKTNFESLCFLMGNSPNLQQLFLGRMGKFDNNMMRTMLRDNLNFPNLIRIGIKECRDLSSVGVNMLIDRAPNLKETYFATGYSSCNVHRIVNNDNFNMLYFLDTYKIRKREFYIYTPNPCTF